MSDGSFKDRKPRLDKAAPGTTRRLLSYLLAYRWQLAVIVVCIIISAGAQAASAFFLQPLIDHYILPWSGPPTLTGDR